MADDIKKPKMARPDLGEQQDRKKQDRKKIGRPIGGPIGGLGKGKKKEDSSVTLGKFMKAKIDSTNESVKGGGMKADRVIEGSNMRRKKDFRKDIEEGKYKQTKDADYYKSIGLTGKRGDAAVEDFFKPDKIRLKNITAGKYAKGGRAGYKYGKSVKKKGGCAIKGKSPILR